MNEELVLIFDSIRNWSKTNRECKGDLLDLVGTLTKPWKCHTVCHLCIIAQSRIKASYQELIIQTFSQLNK